MLSLRLEHLVFVLLDDDDACARMCEVLFVAYHALQHLLPIGPVHDHEQVLFETVASHLGETVRVIWRQVYFFK